MYPTETLNCRGYCFIATSGKGMFQYNTVVLHCLRGFPLLLCIPHLLTEYPRVVYIPGLRFMMPWTAISEGAGPALLQWLGHQPAGSSEEHGL